MQTLFTLNFIPNKHTEEIQSNEKFIKYIAKIIWPLFMGQGHSFSQIFPFNPIALRVARVLAILSAKGLNFFHLQAELDRQRTRLTEENNMLASENEKLVLKVEDLRNDVKLNEEALTQYTVQQNLQLSNSKQESAMLSNTLDKERVNREKIQSEVGIRSFPREATLPHLSSLYQSRAFSCQ